MHFFLKILEPSELICDNKSIALSEVFDELLEHYELLLFSSDFIRLALGLQLLNLHLTSCDLISYLLLRLVLDDA